MHGLGQSYGQCGHDLRLTKVKNSADVVAFTFSSGVRLMSFTLCVTMNWLLDATAHSKTMSSSGSRPAGAGGGGGAGARSQPAKLSLDHVMLPWPRLLLLCLAAVLAVKEDW